MENSTLQKAGPDEQESMSGASGDPALLFCSPGTVGESPPLHGPQSPHQESSGGW